MKKSLITLALAGISGSAIAATSNVDISGKMRMYVESYEAGTASALNRVTNDNSSITIKANEDLGGGLGLNVVISTGVNIDAPSATSLGDFQSTVGISSGTMRADIGRDKHNLRKTIDQFDVLGVAYGSIASSVHTLRDSRLNNSVALTGDVAGASVGYMHGFSENATTSATQSYGVAYGFGPAKVGYASYDNNAGSKSKLVGGKIVLDDTTLTGMYSEDTTAGTTIKGKSIGVAQKLTPALTMYASYGTNKNVDAYAVKASYALSKRTAIHAAYSNVDSVVAANDVTRYGVGLEHNF